MKNEPDYVSGSFIHIKFSNTTYNNTNDKAKKAISSKINPTHGVSFSKFSNLLIVTVLNCYEVFGYFVLAKYSYILYYKRNI